MAMSNDEEKRLTNQNLLSQGLIGKQMKVLVFYVHTFENIQNCFLTQGKILMVTTTHNIIMVLKMTGRIIMVWKINGRP